jgi:hypothetical protein
MGNKIVNLEKENDLLAYFLSYRGREGEEEENAYAMYI